ncbi:MAG: thioredoxin [Bacteroidetes bacterium]|jgi:thioredoxin 1|nr:thioredoxin [Bacteroidota bacterium]
MSAFSDLINSDQPVLVDFYADWCGPCKTMAPVLKNVAGKLGDKVKIIKVDVDKNPAAAAKYNVRSIPTFIIFKKGQIKWQQSGALPEGMLVDVLKGFV